MAAPMVSSMAVPMVSTMTSPMISSMTAPMVAAKALPMVALMIRVKYLWLKSRMYVRLLNRIGLVKVNIEDRMAPMTVAMFVPTSLTDYC